MKKTIGALLLCMVTVVGAAGGGNLTVPRHITLSNAFIGQSHSLETLSGARYELSNYVRNNLAINITITAPRVVDPAYPDFEPIPDVSWVSLEKNAFVLAYEGVASTDFTVAIPDDPRYLGKKYQFNISLTAPDFPHVAIPDTKVFMTISEDRIPMLQLIERLGLGVLAFDILPGECTVSDIPLGKPVDLAACAQQEFRLVNRSEQTYAFEIDAGEFLFLDADELVVKPRSEKVISGHLLIPDEEAYRGKKLSLTITARVAGQKPEHTKTATIFLTTEGGGHIRK
jgi:hypothetical protein